MEALLWRWIHGGGASLLLEPFLAEKEEHARRSRQVNGEEDSRRHSVYHCNQPRHAGATLVHCFHAVHAS